MAERASFLARHLGPALAAAALLPALERTGADSAVSRWFFDPVARAFPLRHNQWLELLGHEWAKALVVFVAVCTIGLYLMSFLVPALEPRRRLLLFLSAALTAAPLAVVLLKAASVRHCPWSLREFGGSAPHLMLFDAAVPGLPPGHCFPSGHASAGFSLLAFYFAGRALGNRRLARAGLWGGLAAGTAFGMVRVAQGAHFLSHNLWSALVCWLVILALYIVLLGRAEAERAAQGGAPGPAGCARASLQPRSRL
ncbi:MAG TPA: phosphatase PAP2 family protein [Burkholderiales bacterium]|nr:phosphatase PAP2 family protein [Burkholderiales bacterium]